MNINQQRNLNDANSDSKYDKYSYNDIIHPYLEGIAARIHDIADIQYVKAFRYATPHIEFAIEYLYDWKHYLFCSDIVRD